MTSDPASQAKSPEPPEPPAVCLDSVIMRLTPDRLGKYMERAKQDKALALHLYVWNNELGPVIN